jgi:hypothetical protein
MSYHICRVYNNHVFLDWRDRRLSNGSINLNNMSAHSLQPIQSLPPFANPCEDIWARYFATDTNHTTWFTGKHKVNRDRMVFDCNKTVLNWQLGLRQIRIIRNITKPLASHNIQAAYPSNLASMKDSYHILMPNSTLAPPIHYFNTSLGLKNLISNPGIHAFHNPSSGSLLTKASSWPPEVGRALGFQSTPTYQLEDDTWWNDMTWYLNPILNKTFSPRNKTIPGQRYWGWNPSFPSTYASYKVVTPQEAWPAHLYGTLPKAWAGTNGTAGLANLRIM